MTSHLTRDIRKCWICETRTEGLYFTHFFTTELCKPCFDKIIHWEREERRNNPTWRRLIE